MNYRVRWRYTNRPDDAAWKEFFGLGSRINLNQAFIEFARQVKNFSSNTTYDFDVVMKEENQ